MVCDLYTSFFDGRLSTTSKTSITCYYLRIPFGALFADGFESGDASAWSSATP
jgi:hypothetical protein